MDDFPNLRPIEYFRYDFHIENCRQMMGKTLEDCLFPVSMSTAIR
jgi:hypothetical protein